MTAAFSSGAYNPFAYVTDEADGEGGGAGGPPPEQAAAEILPPVVQNPSYRDVIRTAWTRTVRATVHGEGGLSDPVGTTDTAGLPVNLVGGHVDYDTNRANAWTGQLQLISETDDRAEIAYLNDLFAHTSRSPIAIDFGVEAPGGTSWSFRHGVFYVDRRRRTVAADGRSQWNLTLRDRSTEVTRRTLLDRIRIASGTLIVDALLQILSARFPEAGDPIVLATTSQTVERSITLDVGADPWAEIQRLAASAGFFAEFTPTGQFIVGLTLDPRSADPTVEWGPEIVNYFDDDDSGDTFNGVRIIGTSSYLLTPVKAERFIDDPSDPLYPKDDLHRHAQIERSPYVYSTAGAERLAEKRIMELLGRGDRINLPMIPDPSLAPRTVAQLDLPDIDDNVVVLDGYRLPIRNNEATARVRRTRQ